MGSHGVWDKGFSPSYGVWSAGCWPCSGLGLVGSAYYGRWVSGWSYPEGCHGGCKVIECFENWGVGIPNSMVGWVMVVWWLARKAGCAEDADQSVVIPLWSGAGRGAMVECHFMDWGPGTRKIGQSQHLGVLFGGGWYWCIGNCWVGSNSGCWFRQGAFHILQGMQLLVVLGAMGVVTAGRCLRGLWCQGFGILMGGG